MHNITITTTIDDATETTVLPYEFESQEEIAAFLSDYVLVELDKLYDALKAMGDRTTALVEPAAHRSLVRTISGTSRRDGRAPIHGETTIRVERVA